MDYFPVLGGSSNISRSYLLHTHLFVFVVLLILHIFGFGQRCNDVLKTGQGFAECIFSSEERGVGGGYKRLLTGFVPLLA